SRRSPRSQVPPATNPVNLVNPEILSKARLRKADPGRTLCVRCLQSLVLLCTLIYAVQAQQPPGSPTPTPTPLPPPTVRIDPYRAAAARIIGAALTSDRAYSRLAHLTDHIGNRLSGSKNLERALDWAIAEMKRDELDNVHAEKVMVPHWVRGEESLEMLSPVQTKLQMLGLGNSVGKPAEGIAAEAVVVRDFAELDRLGDKVRGKIVVYNAPYVNYGATVVYRLQGASRAARYGAVAALVRSITPVSLQTPHTGAMNYDPNQPKIPVAAVTIEVAEYLQRM